MRARRWVKLGVVLASLLVLPPAVAWSRVALDDATPSRSSGTTARGALSHGHPIPPWGPGWKTHSFLGAALGRQYVHGAVRDALTAAFRTRAQAEPGRVFVLGETGKRSGGAMAPHRTHQNGMSVDVFAPLHDADGAPATPPTWPWLTFGYGLEFDARGRRGDLAIDFESLAALLHEVDAQARARSLHLARVYIAPEYVPRVLATPAGRALGPVGDVLSRRGAWVRHDEHVHLDFGGLYP